MLIKSYKLLMIYIMFYSNLILNWCRIQKSLRV